MPSLPASACDTSSSGGGCSPPDARWLPGPPVLLLISLVAMGLLHVLIPGPRLPLLGWRLAGLLPLAAGIGLNPSADQAMKKVGTTVKPFRESSALLVDGVFAVTRNPMYFGMILLLVGTWVLLGSLSPGLFPVAFAVVLDRNFRRPEEQKMALAFGSEFESYRCKVRRWI
jgi:protein-S-isoprenylcysteine O-methyltransferase Ste14